MAAWHSAGNSDRCLRDREARVCLGRTLGPTLQDPHAKDEGGLLLLAIYLSGTTTLKVPAGTAPLLALGEGNAETARSREAFCRGLHTQGIYDLAQRGRGKLRGQKEKFWTRGKRQKKGAAGAISPLASPSGLKEAVGVTVLVESMKLREAQKIPDRTLLSSFQDLSTLDGDTNPLTVPRLPLLPPSKPAAGHQAIRLAS